MLVVAAGLAYLGRLATFAALRLGLRYIDELLVDPANGARQTFEHAGPPDRTGIQAGSLPRRQVAGGAWQQGSTTLQRRFTAGPRERRPQRKRRASPRLSKVA